MGSSFSSATSAEPIDVTLDKEWYQAGDTITGSVKLYIAYEGRLAQSINIHIGGMSFMRLIHVFPSKK